MLLRETRISLEGRFDFRSINLVKSGGLDTYSILRDRWKGEERWKTGKGSGLEEVFNSLKFPATKTGSLEVIVPRVIVFQGRETLRCNCCCKLSAISSRRNCAAFVESGFQCNRFFSQFFCPPPPPNFRAFAVSSIKWRIKELPIQNCQPILFLPILLHESLVLKVVVVKNSDKRYVESKFFFFFIIVAHFFSFSFQISLQW